MIVVTGKQQSELTRERLDERIAGRHVTLDLGAGDGLFAYRYAREHSERFVIAVDPVAENFREPSAKAAKKQDRGGAPNAVYVVASVEHVPQDLRGIADEITITLPWGSLMRGLILGDATVLDGVASVARSGARLRIILNTRIFDDPVPIEARDLPEVTREYVRATLTTAYAGHRIRITDTRTMPADEVAAVGTTWAKRLSHRRPPPSVLIEAVVE